MNIDQTLSERGTRYGEFIDNAAASQGPKSIVKIELFCRNEHLKEDQIEIFNMICHKIARIISEAPDYVDILFEVENYAPMVANRLETKKWTSEKPQDGEKKMGSHSAFPPLF